MSSQPKCTADLSCNFSGLSIVKNAGFHLPNLAVSVDYLGPTIQSATCTIS